MSKKAKPITAFGDGSTVIIDPRKSRKHLMDVTHILDSIDKSMINEGIERGYELETVFNTVNDSRNKRQQAKVTISAVKKEYDELLAASKRTIKCPFSKTNAEESFSIVIRDKETQNILGKIDFVSSRIVRDSIEIKIAPGTPISELKPSEIGRVKATLNVLPTSFVGELVALENPK